MTVPTYTWRKDGHLHSQYHGDNILDLESVTVEDKGRYICVISGHEELNSSYVDITVKPGSRSSSWITITVGITAAALMTSVMLIVFILWLIRRKRGTQSEKQNHRGSRQDKTMESPEGTYMTLDPKSRSSEYDTLDNMKRCCENTDRPEDQESSYQNIDSSSGQIGVLYHFLSSSPGSELRGWETVPVLTDTV